MSLRAVSPTAECSHHGFQAFAPSLPSFPFTSSPHPKKYTIVGPVSSVVLSNPFVSETLLKPLSFNKDSRSHTVRRSCSANLDDTYGDEPSFRVEGLASNSSGGADGHEEEGHRKNNKLHCAISKNSNSPFIDNKRGDQDSFLHTRFDFLEPMMLGIRPEFPDRPDEETVSWAVIEQKAKSFDIPLSLRMIKKKLQWEEGLTDSKDSAYCSVKVAFSSMVFIVVELQSSALHMREALCDEDLESITLKVQRDMHSSFVWLFQQVFSRTPSLMLHVMLLLADLGVYSAFHNIAMGETSLSRAFIEHTKDGSSLSSLVTENGSESTIDEKMKLPQISKQASIYPDEQLGSGVEMNSCDSMVDDATKMSESINEKVLDHDTVSKDLEPNRYENHLRTDLLYQMHLSMEPNNPLLLGNYAQFLYLVAHDYDRAEECFKRALQVSLPDAESLYQYANFLWTVRKDYLGAEESFLHALSIQPYHSHYACCYANFLWSTGGEGTCFPLSNSETPNV